MKSSPVTDGRFPRLIEFLLAFFPMLLRFTLAELPRNDLHGVKLVKLEEEALFGWTPS